MVENIDLKVKVSHKLQLFILIKTKLKLERLFLNQSLAGLI